MRWGLSPSFRFLCIGAMGSVRRGLSPSFPILPYPSSYHCRRRRRSDRFFSEITPVLLSLKSEIVQILGVVCSDTYDLSFSLWTRPTGKEVKHATATTQTLIIRVLPHHKSWRWQGMRFQRELRSCVFPGVFAVCSGNLQFQGSRILCDDHAFSHRYQVQRPYSALPFSECRCAVLGLLSQTA